jgi:DNA-binding Lrp family transcriptional regulator
VSPADAADTTGEAGMAKTRMTQRDDVDELDVMLLDALHANPRISFERLGPVLDVSPATIARRWQRLVESGRAWVSSVPGPRLEMVAAVVDVRAVPGRALSVAAALAAIPQVASVYATDGESDLHTLVLAADMRSLAVLLLERVPTVPGIAATRSQTGLRWHSPVRWRLGAIDSQQKRTVTDGDTADSRATARDRVPESVDRALFLALQQDGRARLRDLARDLDTSEDFVRRRIDMLVRREMLGFRTDFARGAGGWPAEYVFWLAVPPRSLDQVGGEISAWPETRICMSTVGHANLMVMSQVHRTTDVSGLLDRLDGVTPAIGVVDHRLVLRAIKSWGRILDPVGRAVGVVPVDPWAAPGSTGREPGRSGA